MERTPTSYRLAWFTGSFNWIAWLALRWDAWVTRPIALRKAAHLSRRIAEAATSMDKAAIALAAIGLRVEPAGTGLVLVAGSLEQRDRSLHDTTFCTALDPWPYEAIDAHGPLRSFIRTLSPMIEAHGQSGPVSISFRIRVEDWAAICDMMEDDGMDGLARGLLAAYRDALLGAKVATAQAAQVELA